MNLINRMSQNESVTSSEDSVSWNAYREAEALTDIIYFPMLKEFILAHMKPKERQFRRSAYFILSRLLKVELIEEYVVFYLEQLKVECDKCILSSMLESIADDIAIPAHISIEYIIILSKHDQWLIRH